MLSRRSRHGSLFAVAALTTLGVAAPAGAAPTGATTIDLKGASAKALSSQKVRIAAQKPARASAKRIVLAVSGGTVAGGATLKHKGSVTFSVRAGGRTRSAKLTGWETKVGTTRSTVTAKLGAKRVTLFTIAAPKARVTLDRAAGTAKLTRGTVRLTPAGAKALRAKLALRRLPAGQLGVAKVSASVGAARAPSTPTPGTPDPAPVTPPTTRCEGFGTGSVPAASAPLARPETGASAVTAAPMSWYPRDSWTRYINGGLRTGDGMIASEGASLGPVEHYPEPSDTFSDPTRGPRLPYAVLFTFDPSQSWYTPASATGRLAYTGTVRFYWADHGIDITFKNPEIELNGPSSRIVFTMIGAACSNLPAKRVEMFATTVPTPTGGPAGPFAYDPIATKISRDGATIFSGQYEQSQAWGSIRGLTITTAP